ncbi:protocadherin gamma-A8-like isoform X3 [Acipenser ruthenus]|uniref:protocadherin gamma-A8-like isoform X3 n=1 Tax=Acipenser ruthenus TaxID=7906 RepID=UPI002741133D|nr:protocadherin gamma-A8-like isoform X3 [Acipenser ruthenus]
MLLFLSNLRKRSVKKEQWTEMRQVQAILIIMSLINMVWGELRYTISEEMEQGSFIGNIALDLRLDVKQLTARNARVVSEGKGQYCQLNVNTGIVFVNERIDREELCAQTTVCTLEFQIILDNPFMFHSIVLEIQDTNDNSPSFSENEITFEIPESTLPGARFPLESAHDPDVGSNSIQSYVLSKNDHFTLDVGTRDHGTSYGELVLEKALDREQKAGFSIILSAIDGGIPQRSGTININIIVMDANDNAPVFSKSVYKATLDENSPMNTLIIKINATDIDEGQFGDVTYSFRHLSDKARKLFNIDANTGEIRVAGIIDFETEKAFELDIQAKDSGNLASHCKVLVEILDVNDNAPLISLKSLYSSITEDSLPGTMVALIGVSDQDSGDNGQVQCSIQDNLPFKLVLSGKNYYRLITDSALDRENDSEYNITVTATDKGLPPLSATQIIHVKVSDVNDNPPTFHQTSYSVYVMENNSQGTSILSLQAKDLDTDQNAHITYSVYGDGIQAQPLLSYVSVNTDSGDIFALRSFDYEEFREFEIHVKAQDSGSPPLSSNVTVKVFIIDQNDNAPQILYPVQSDVSVVFEMLPRAAQAGYLVTKVVAVDADSGQNAWLSYELNKVTEQGLFSIGFHNGEIKTLRDVTDKDTVKQRLIVLIKDNGQPSYSSTVTLNVVISDSFPDLSEFKDFADDTTRKSNLTLYLVISLAAVSSLFLVSIIVLISFKYCTTRNSKFQFESSNGNYPALPTSYFPPHYADVGTGTLQQRYSYEVCLTSDSGKSEFKYVKPCTENNSGNDLINPQNFNTILYDGEGRNMKTENVYVQQKPANTDWRFSQGQRPGPSGSQRPEEAGPWPNPPTEAEQLQALMAAANEVSAATATLDAGTMGLSTRYSPQFTLQHVPDYRQNVYIPGSTSTLTGSNSQAEGKNPQPSSGNKKKSGKKEKK